MASAKEQTSDVTVSVEEDPSTKLRPSFDSTAGEAQQLLRLVEREMQSIRQTMAEQQQQISALSVSNDYLVQSDALFWDHYCDLDAQHRMLCDCLHKMGLLHRGDLLAHRRAHRRRSLLADLLDQHQVVRNLLLCCDLRLAGWLSAVSKAAMDNLTCSLSELVEEGSESLRSQESFWLNRRAPRRQILQLRRSMQLLPAALLPMPLPAPSQHMAPPAEKVSTQPALEAPPPRRPRGAFTDLLGDRGVVRALLRCGDLRLVERLVAASKAAMDKLARSLSDIVADGSECRRSPGGFWPDRSAPPRQTLELRQSMQLLPAALLQTTHPAPSAAPAALERQPRPQPQLPSAVPPPSQHTAPSAERAVWPFKFLTLTPQRPRNAFLDLLDDPWVLWTLLLCGGLSLVQRLVPASKVAMDNLTCSTSDLVEESWERWRCHESPWLKRCTPLFQTEVLTHSTSLLRAKLLRTRRLAPAVARGTPRPRRRPQLQSPSVALEASQHMAPPAEKASAQPALEVPVPHQPWSTFTDLLANHRIVRIVLLCSDLCLAEWLVAVSKAALDKLTRSLSDLVADGSELRRSQEGLWLNRSAPPRQTLELRHSLQLVPAALLQTPPPAPAAARAAPEPQQRPEARSPLAVRAPSQHVAPPAEEALTPPASELPVPQQPRRTFADLLDDDQIVRSLLLCGDLRLVEWLAAVSKAAMDNLTCSLSDLVADSSECQRSQEGDWLDWLNHCAPRGQTLELRDSMQLLPTALLQTRPSTPAARATPERLPRPQPPSSTVARTDLQLMDPPAAKTLERLAVEVLMPQQPRRTFIDILGDDTLVCTLLLFCADHRLLARLAAVSKAAMDNPTCSFPDLVAEGPESHLSWEGVGLDRYDPQPQTLELCHSMHLLPGMLPAAGQNSSLLSAAARAALEPQLQPRGPSVVRAPSQLMAPQAEKVSAQPAQEARRHCPPPPTELSDLLQPPRPKLEDPPHFAGATVDEPVLIALDEPVLMASSGPLAADGAVTNAEADGASASAEANGALPSTATNGALPSARTDGTLLSARTDGDLASARTDGTSASARTPGGSCLEAFLQDVWQYSSLADSLICSMGLRSVQQFRAVSRSCAECMRTATSARTAASARHRGGSCDSLVAKPLVRRFDPCQPPSARGGGCLVLLQEVWQYPHLGELLAHAMGATSVRRFCTVSRAGCECMRPCCRRKQEHSRPDEMLQRKERDHAARRRGRPARYDKEGLAELAAWSACSSAKSTRAQASGGSSGSRAERGKGTGGPPAKGAADKPPAGVPLACRPSEAEPLTEFQGSATGAQAGVEHPAERQHLGRAGRSKARSLSSLTSQQLRRKKVKELSQRCFRRRRGKGTGVDPKGSAGFDGDTSDHTPRSNSSGSRRRKALVGQLAPAPPVETELHGGLQVQLQGLRTRQDLNGLTGELVEYMDDWGRWKVFLANGGTVRVRSSNLTLVARRQEQRLPTPVARPLTRLPHAGARQPSSRRADLLQGHASKVLSFTPLRSRLAFAAASRDARDVAARQGRVYVCGGSDGQNVLRSAECLDLTSGRWARLPPMEMERSAAGHAALGGRLYVFGGKGRISVLCSVECFDPASGSWQAMPAMSRCRSFPMTGVLKGRVYVCGGCAVGGGAAAGEPAAAASSGQQRGNLIALDSTECFDPQRREWQPMPPMKTGRYSAAVATIGGLLYIVGGTGPRALSAVEAFDPDQRAWHELAGMLEPRCFAASAHMRSYLYAMGGMSSSKLLKSVERYDLRSGKWEVMPSMHLERYGACAHAVPQIGCIYVCGGGLAPMCNAMYSVEAFSPAASRWEVLRPMSQSRSFGCAVAAAGHLYVLGGSAECDPSGSAQRDATSQQLGRGGHVLSSAERLSLASGTCEPLPAMESQRLGAVAGFLPL